MITANQASAEQLILALTVYREAANEPDHGRIAVAWTLRNRVQHPKWWGRDFYGVATAKWQYSSISAPGDNQLGKWPKWDDPIFQRCLEIAGAVIAGAIAHPMPGADSYYADYIPVPRWATDDKMVGKIGHHIFYNLDEDRP